MRSSLAAAVIVSLSFLPLTCFGASADGAPGREAFRAIYQERVETDSSATTGSCTKVVRAAATRLKAAGFSSDDVQVVIEFIRAIRANKGTA